MKKKQGSRVKRTYDLSPHLYAWLQEKAEKENRPVIRQLEVIVERARASEQQPKIVTGNDNDH